MKEATARSFADNPSSRFSPKTGPKPCRACFFRAQSGQSLIEVSLLVPLIIALFFGAVELGRFAYITILVGNAARAGAAYGSQSLLDATTPSGASVNPGIQTAADNDFQNNGQNTSAITVTSSTTCGCDYDGTFTAASACTTTGSSTAGTCASGQWVVLVNVTVSGTFQPIFRYPWISNSITLTKTVTMRVNMAG
jgi:Flp pilus assembly protein TadG